MKKLLLIAITCIAAFTNANAQITLENTYGNGGVMHVYVCMI
jgi:hypothetical protein